MVNSRSSGRNLMKHLHRSALGTLAAMSLIWTLVPAATADQHSGKPTDGDGIVGIAAPEFPDPNSEPSVTPEPSIEPTANAPIDPPGSILCMWVAFRAPLVCLAYPAYQVMTSDCRTVSGFHTAG